MKFRVIPWSNNSTPALYGQIIVELKAVDKLHEKHRAQLLNYLHSTGLKVGLLVNFGHFPRVEIERFAL